MRLFLLPVVAVLCVCAAATPRKSNLISRFVNKYLDNISNQTLSLGDAKTKNGSLSNLELLLNVEEKKVDGVGSWGVKMNITLRDLLLKGLYDIEYLDIKGLFPIYGNGNLRLEVASTHLELTIMANPKLEDDTFDVTLTHFKINLQNTKLRMDNLMNDPHLADFLSELIGDLIPDFVHIFHDKLYDGLKSVTPTLGNIVIKCIREEILTGKVGECIRNALKSDKIWDFQHILLSN